MRSDSSRVADNQKLRDDVGVNGEVCQSSRLEQLVTFYFSFEEI